jgi:hypothetical protein
MPAVFALALLSWLQPGQSFTTEPAALECRGSENSRNWIRTRAEYGDLRLRFDYRLAQWAEAIVVLRAHADGRPTLTGIPIQFAHDFHNKPGLHVTGAVAGLRAPEKSLPPSFDLWHSVDITLRGDRVSVRIDNELVNETTVPDRHASGHIGFLDLGHAYSIRSIRVDDLGTPRAYQPLFNGRDLAGWQLRDAGAWSINAGVLIAANGHGIHYAPGEFTDFDLLAVVRSVGHVNAGIFLRGQPDKSRLRGLEVQIYSPPDAVYPTGSIYGQTRADLVADHDGQWTLLRVRVHQGVVTTWVDGRLAARGPVPPGVPASGRVGLQIHLANARIECRELRIRHIGVP